MNRKNRGIVLNFLIQSDCHYFKCKGLAKKITDLNTRQVSNGLQYLRKEGYIEKHNLSGTWRITDKMEELRVKL